jgi:hypothetical protein
VRKKPKRGKEYVYDVNWGVVALLVPGRSNFQCRDRWLSNGSVVSVTNRMRCPPKRWTKDEESKLEEAVELHGTKNWEAVAVLVSTRTNIQCRSKWTEKERKKKNGMFLRPPPTQEIGDAVIKAVIEHWSPNLKHANATAYIEDRSSGR